LGESITKGGGKKGGKKHGPCFTRGVGCFSFLRKFLPAKGPLLKGRGEKGRKGFSSNLLGKRTYYSSSNLGGGNVHASPHKGIR